MKRTILPSLSLCIALLATGQAVTAQELGYSQAGMQYFNQQLDDANCRQDGLTFNGSLDLDGDWFALGSFTDVGGDEGCGSSTLSAGGGYRTAFDATFDMYGTLSFETTSPDVGGSDSGLVLTGGLRGFVAQEIEAKVELAHHTVFDGATTVTAGGAYWFDPRFAATTDLTLSSNGTAFALGVRMDF